MMTDAFGGAILIFIFLTQNDPRTALCKDAALKMIIVAGSYVVATLIARGGYEGASPINPAIAMGLIGAEVLQGDYVYAWGWVLMVFPLLGGLLGLLCYECFYLKTEGAAKEEEDMDHDKEDGQEYGGDGHFGNNPYAAHEPLMDD